MTAPMPSTGSLVFPQRVNIGVLKTLYANLDKIPDDSAFVKSLYKNMIEKNKTELMIDYKSKDAEAGWGRLYGSSNSLAYMSRRVRGSLCAGLYHDLDIVNCHAVLLSQYAKRYINYDMKELNKYNSNRDEYLKLISEHRNDAKTAINTILNNGDTAFEHLQPMKNEIRAVLKMLKTRPELEPLVKKFTGDHKPNVSGRLMAAIMQSEELKCLRAMITALKADGWGIGTLIYDGLHVRVDGEKEIPISKIEDAVFIETGYRINVSVKPFECLDLSDFKEAEDVDAADPIIYKDIRRSAYLAKKAEFEKAHFYFIPNDMITTFEGGKMIMYGREHAETALGPAWAFSHSSNMLDTTSFIKLWLADKDRLSYSTIGYVPDGSKMFIRPIEYIADRYKPPTVSILPKFHELLDHVSDKNPLIKEYLIKWFARMIQKPTENAGTAIIVTGEQGVGKDMLGEIVGKYVLGMSNFADYTSSEQFWEKHDCGTEGKILVKLQEAVGYLAHKNAGRFKARITTPRETYNPKGSKAYECDNLAHYYLTTNESSPVKIERTDRRFFLFRAGNYKRGDKTFWDAIWAACATNEGGAEIAAFLRGIDITTFNPSDIPEIAERLDAMEVEEDVETKFLNHWDGAECTALELYELFVSYCHNNHYPCGSNTGFGRKLLPHIGRLIIKRRDSAGIKYKKA